MSKNQCFCCLPLPPRTTIGSTVLQSGPMVTCTTMQYHFFPSDTGVGSWFQTHNTLMILIHTRFPNTTFECIMQSTSSNNMYVCMQSVIEPFQPSDVWEGPVAKAFYYFQGCKSSQSKAAALLPRAQTSVCLTWSLALWPLTTCVTALSLSDILLRSIWCSID